MEKTASVTGVVLHAAIRHHHAMGDMVYGVVDAARDRELAFAAPERFEQTIHWLFEEGSGAHMHDAAPYLVPIAYRRKYPYAGSGYLDLWAEKLGTSAGILLITPADPDALREHLGGIFRVSDESDHRYYFRFYDPRVLRLYLPTCTADEAREFFGPIRRILVEASDPGTILSCGPGPSGVKIDERPIAEIPGTPTNRYRR